VSAAAELAWMQGRLGKPVPTLERAHELAVRSGSRRWIGETAIWPWAGEGLGATPEGVEPAPRLMIEGRFPEAGRGVGSGRCSLRGGSGPGNLRRSIVKSGLPSSTGWVPLRWRG
jgi:hypothetical protein